MNEPLTVRLLMGPQRMRVVASGDVRAANAHLLSKVVEGALRRYAAPAIEVDLLAVQRIDDVGVAALWDCQRESERRGVLFTITGVSPQARRSIAQYGSVELLRACAPEPLNAVRPPLRQPQTGSVCRWAVHQPRR